MGEKFQGKREGKEGGGRVEEEGRRGEGKRMGKGKGRGKG